jgi:spore coat protein U-like protein
MRALRLAALVLGALAAAPGAHAASCTASASATAFGTYDPQSTLPHDSLGSVTVTCAPVLVAVLQSYAIALSAGSSGSYAPRRMAAGAWRLDYQLYSDALRSVVWGDGTAGTSTVAGSFLLSVLLPVSATHVVYGRIPARQTGVAAGNYADTITVTVTY